MNKKSKGFTLIELMIVVAIIGLLTAVSISFFGDNVVSSNRTDGRAALGEGAASLEKCKSLYGTYNNANCNSVVPGTSSSGYYTITNVRAVSTFTLTATPVTGQPQANDTSCTRMTLTNTGLKGGTPTTNECW